VSFATAKKIFTRINRHPAGVKKGNPEYKQDFIDNDSNFPMSHYGHISEPSVPSVDIPRFIDPYELKGSVLTPLYGDHTDAGRRLKSILIGDLQFDLDRPVELMGGPRFGLFQRYNEDPNAIWASDKGAVSKYAAGWKGLSEKYGGADVLPVFTGQGRKAQQSNTMFADVLSQMLNNSPLTRASQKLFDEKSGKIIPDFVGMRSEKLFDQLRNLSFDKRGEFMKNFVSSKPIQQGGFPDMVAIGNALTDPGVHPDARMAGYVISKANLDDLVNRSPLFPHPSYKNNLHGEVLGGFREQIPAKLMWRPAYEARMPQAEPKYLETNGPYIGRYMDDEAIDEISQYIEDAAAARKLGGYAEGGLYTDEERARRAEEQMGGVTPDGYASSLPPTLSMQFGDLVSPYLDAAYDLFPKENPRGKFLRDAIMGEAPEAARRMAEGEPYVLANTRSRNPLDWKINSEALDMAGALPVATATGALGKAAAAMKASAPLLGGFGVIKQKGGNWLPPVLETMMPIGTNEHTIPGRIAEQLLMADGYERADFRNPPLPWREMKEGIYEPLDESLYNDRLAKRSAARKFKFGNYISEDPESVLEEINLARANGYTPEVRENAQNYLDKYRESLGAKKEVNTWLQKQLARYMQSDMGTAGDPIKATIERRMASFDKERDAALREAQTHFDHAAKLEAEGPRPGMPEGTWENAIQAAKNRGQQISEDAIREYELKSEYGSSHLLRNDEYFNYLRLQDIKEKANVNRLHAGFPEETTGLSDAGKEWDDIADSSIGVGKKKNIFGEEDTADSWLGNYRIPIGAWDTVQPEYFHGALKENPWIHNLEGETPFHYITTGEAHRIPKLKYLLLETIGRDDIPDNLKTKLSDLPNLSVGAAVDKAADLQIFDRRKKLQEMLDAQKNPAIHRMTEYPTGHAWNELKLPELPEDEYQMRGREFLEKALNMEGSHMAHCVGGYCDKVADGSSRIFSLRDKDGNPHVTIETRAPSDRWWNEYWDSLPNRDEVIGPDSVLANTPGMFNKGHQQLYNEASKLYDLPPPPVETVEQIKGKNNSSVSGKYLPMVRDFLQSRGRWGGIGDQPNSGLSDKEIRELTEDPALKSVGNLDDLENIDWQAEGEPRGFRDPYDPNGGNLADGGLVNGDRVRLNSIIGDFLSDNPGQYAELGEPRRRGRVMFPNEVALNEMREERRRRPAEFQLDLGLAPTDSNNGLGGGGHAGMRLPIGPATLSVDAVGGGGYGQQVNPEGYLGYGPRGPVMRVGKPKFGGGASLAGIQAAIEGLPGLAGRYGISYDTQPFMLTQTLGLDERGMPRASRGDLIGGQGIGNSQRIWDRMLPDEKLMFTYNREF
jgi:hypothetical protein